MSASLEKFLNNIARHDVSSLEIINSLQKMMIDESDSIRVEYTTENGKETFDVPSLSYLMRRLDRIDRNIRNMSSEGEFQAYVVTNDGTRRQIVNQRRFTPNPVEVGDLEISNIIYTHEDVRGEKTTYMDVDISKQLEDYKYEVTHVQIKKLFIRGNNFDKEKLGSRYQDIVSYLQGSTISYSEQESIVPIKPRSRNINRDFYVVDISSDGYLIGNMDGQNLAYVETLEDNTKITRSINIGTKFSVGKNSLYRVTEINKATGHIRMETIYGTEGLSVGDIIKIDVEDEFGTIVPVALHSSEPFLLFVKPINKNWISSDTWGSCTMFVTPGNDVAQKISQTSSTVKKNISVKPNAPVLEAKNLQVKMINSHLVNQFETRVREKYSEKENVKSQIDILDTSITKLKDKMGETIDRSQREKLQKEIDEKYKSRKNLVNTFHSLVNDILTHTRESQEFKPKYRVRGFFAIPEPTTFSDGSSYDIIKFDCQYRYLRTDNTEANVETIDYVLPSGDKLKAYYSNWNTLPMNQREKVYDLQTGEYLWKSENELDADSINPNQLDIPISRGEYVEIRVRSISEAGFPTIINMSEWSSSVIVEFPQHLIDTSSRIFDGIGDDNLQTIIEKELASIGVYDHLSDSHTSGDKTFHHSARNVSTDYFTDGENKQKSVMQVLDEMKRIVDSVVQKYSVADSPLQISILNDKEEKIADVQNNDHIKIFAGYYKNETQSDTKGAIVQKTYYISIKNPKSIDAELLSYVPGFDTPITDNVSKGYVYDERTYATRKYNLPRIGYKTDSSGNHTLPYGSPQNRGQFIYQRSCDVTLQREIVKNLPDVGFTTSGGSSPYGFIANIDGGKLIEGDGILTDFCFHKEHPLLKTISKLDSEHKQTIQEVISKSKQSGSFAGNLVEAVYGDSSKVGFHHNDKYLIGKNTCGAYLYISPQNPRTISTNTNIYNKGLVINNSEIRIPLIFECRMTDFYGDGTQGSGRVDGVDGVKNVIYEKIIGFDLIQKFIDDIFSFDITVKMKYQED